MHLPTETGRMGSSRGAGGPGEAVLGSPAVPVPATSPNLTGREQTPPSAPSPQPGAALAVHVTFAGFQNEPAAARLPPRDRGRWKFRNII